MVCDYAVFILTHGRPGNVITYKSLKKSGYTGPVYIVIDNEDDAEAEYREAFGNRVIVFDKAAIAKTFDQADNSGDRRAVVYARNACYQIAADLGYQYFIELDDDYKDFRWKFDAALCYNDRPIKDLDAVFEIMWRFYRDAPIDVLAMAQNGDFIGGRDAGMGEKVWLKRKAMNVLFCSTQRRVPFVGLMNEDVTAYVRYGNLGRMFLTVMQVAIIQMQTQNTPGGMSEFYRTEGTYRKSFYPILYQPSSVSIAEMGYVHRRLHHRIDWAKTVPKILSEQYAEKVVDA